MPIPPTSSYVCWFYSTSCWWISTEISWFHDFPHFSITSWGYITFLGKPMQFVKTMVALSMANHLHIPISISQSYACCFGGSTTTIFDTLRWIKHGNPTFTLMIFPLKPRFYTDFQARFCLISGGYIIYGSSLFHHYCPSWLSHYSISLWSSHDPH